MGRGAGRSGLGTKPGGGAISKGGGSVGARRTIGGGGWPGDGDTSMPATSSVNGVADGTGTGA